MGTVDITRTLGIKGRKRTVSHKNIQDCPCFCHYFYFISTGRMDLFWFMASEGSVCHSWMVLAEQNSLHSDIQGAGRENASVYQVPFLSLYPSLPPAYKIMLPTPNASLLLNSFWNSCTETPSNVLWYLRHFSVQSDGQSRLFCVNYNFRM